MMIILDLEADNLMPLTTKIHCAVAYDTESDKYTEFTPRNIHLLPDFLDEINNLCMHNGIGFDLKVLKKIFAYEYKGKYVDSLLLSQILYPDIDRPKGCNGKHSVEAWGIRFGQLKPENEDWSVYTDHMLHRCREDVKIQAQLYLKCKKEMKSFSIRDSRITNSVWSDVIELEQHFWEGMEIQAENGWLLDQDKIIKYIDQLETELNNLELQLSDCLPKILNKPYGDRVCKAFKKDGSLTNTASNWLGPTYFSPGELLGDFSRVRFDSINLNSPSEIKKLLLKRGWTPSSFNFKKDKYNKPLRDNKGNLILTSPKIPKEPEEWDAVSKQIDSPEISLLAGRAKKSHRLNLLKGVRDNLRSDGRIEAKMASCGTNTARARHYNIVNIPRAEEGKYFGKECRSIFTVPEGKILVGCDASALEARCEAHYLYKISRNAASEILEGDIHTKNASIWDVSRSLAKNGKYALTYGCSPKKLAQTLLKPENNAQHLYDSFWDENPALSELVSRLGQQFDLKGYLLAIDGRPLSIRYKHALLNTVLQSAGAIVMKQAWCLFDKWRKKEGLQRLILDVGNFHDEFQVETDPDVADLVGKEMVNSIEKAGQHYNFNVPLTGEYKIGNNWAQTH